MRVVSLVHIKRTGLYLYMYVYLFVHFLRFAYRIYAFQWQRVIIGEDKLVQGKANDIVIKVFADGLRYLESANRHFALV